MPVQKVKKSRDLTLDLLRGYFLFVIIIDHLQSFPSLFEIFTARGGLWISAAEGFFFISGLLVGRLRIAEARRDFKVARHKLLKRAGQLYLVSIILTLLFTIWSHLFHYAPSMSLGLSYDPAWLVVVKIVTLQYSYGLADMLPLYATYLLLSIPALWLILKGRAWLVLLISLALWAIGFSAAEPIRLTKVYFSDISWQVLFFSGLLVGCYFERIWSWWGEFKPVAKRRVVIVLLILLVVLLSISVGIFYHGWIPQSFRPTESFLFDKIKLGLGRVVVFTIFITLAYLVVKRFEDKIVRWVGWLFLPFGQNSLYVYIVQSVIIFAPFGIPYKNIFASSLEDVAVIFVIWWLTTRKVFFKYIPR